MNTFMNYINRSTKGIILTHARILTMKKAKVIVTHQRNVLNEKTQLLQNNSLEFVKVSSLTSFLNEFSSNRKNNLVTSYQAYRYLYDNAFKYPLLKQQLLSYQFCKQFVDFITYCKQLNISLDTFNTTNNLSNEVKTILMDLDQQIPNVNYEFKHKDYDVEFKLCNFDSFINAYLLDKYCIDTTTNIKTIGINKPEIKATMSLSVSQSLTHIASWMINNNINANDVLIISADKSYYPSIIQTLGVYGIPLDTSIDQQATITLQAFRDLYSFLTDTSLPNLFNLIHLGFKINDLRIDSALLKRYQNYVTDLNLHLEDNTNLFDKGNVENYNNLIDQLNQFYNALHPYSNYESNLDLFTNILQLLSKQEFSNNKTLNQINTLLSICYSDLDNDYALRFIMENTIPSITYQTNYPNDSVLLTSLNEPVSSRKYSFVIGLNNQNYPGFKPLSGILDEAFVRDSDYPSLQKRQEYNQESINWIFHSANIITFALSQNSNDGKAMEFPLFINDYSIIYNPELIFNSYSSMNTSLINQEQKLVNDKGKIGTSISAIERYCSCPFSYYMQYVLHITNEREFVGTNTIGSYIHELLDICFKESLHFDQPLKPQLIELSSSLNQSFKPLFTHKENQWNVLYKRIIDGVALLIEYLYNNDLYQHQLDSEVSIKGSIDHFDFKGIVDRIDSNDGYFSIIDYKSSEHTLSVDSLSQGINLQMPTYAYLYDHMSHDQLQDLLYICFNIKNYPYVPYKLSARKGLESIELDDTSKSISIKGYINNKLGIKKFSVDQLFESIELIYQTIYNKMINEPFNIDPIESACTYCAYKSICRFKSSGRKPSAIVNLNKEEDDEME